MIVANQVGMSVIPEDNIIHGIREGQLSWPWRQVFAVLGATALYVLAFAPLYQAMGSTIVALSLLPVIVAGWLFGVTGGVLGALLNIGLNTVLLHRVGMAGSDVLMRVGELPDTATSFLVGAGIGYLHQLVFKFRLQAHQLSGDHVRLQEEVVKRKRTEVALRAHEEEYRSLFAAAQRQAEEAALLEEIRTALAREIDLALVFHTVVERIAQTFGYRQVSLYLIENDELVLQRQVGYHQVLNHIPLATGVMGRVARTGTPVLIEDGQADPNVLWAFPELVSEVCVPLLDEGRVVGVLNLECTKGVTLGQADLRLMTALSEHIGIALTRARLYKAVRDSEEQYRSLVANVKEVIFQLDTHGKWMLLNPAWTELTGFTVANSIGTAVKQYVLPDDLPYVREMTRPLLIHTADTCRFETRFLTTTGVYRWVEVYAHVTTNSAGTHSSIAGTLNDITERKRAEEELRRQNGFLATLHATTPALMQRLEVGDLLTTIVTRAANIVGTSDGYIYLATPDDVLEIKVGIGQFADKIGNRLQRGEGLGGKVWVTGQPLNVEDYDVWSGRAAHIAYDAFHALIGVPLISGQQVVGVLGLAHAEVGHMFSQDEVDLLSRFAQLATIALDNAQLYTSAQQEIAERKGAELHVQEANAHLTTHVATLQQYTYELRLLNEMNELLQTCLSLEEAYSIIATAMQQMFPTEAGVLAMVATGQTLARTMAIWGTPHTALVFEQDDCWALRRRHLHGLTNEHRATHCQHLFDPLPASLVCVPLLARGTLLGVLHLQQHGLTRLTEAQVRLAQTAAGTIALVLANLNLQSTLREQATRDVLTSLFNRRYLEESLEREIRRAHHTGQPLAVLMFDIDHFKQFNDMYGHEVGDTLLRELGTFIQTHIRGEDIACRYGGEEFTVILPGTTALVAQQWAEQIRTGIRQLVIEHDGQLLGMITLSVGIAVLDKHDANVGSILREADAALYTAKHAGRDRIMLAPPPTASIVVMQASKML